MNVSSSKCYLKDHSAETLAVHSFVTIDYGDVIKWNLRNVRKQPVFAKPATYIMTVVYAIAHQFI